MATSAKETAKQENGSRIFLESVIEKGVEPSSKKMFEVYERNNIRMQEWFDSLFEKPNYQSRKHTQAYIKAKLKYLPEDVLIKFAAMIDTILKEEMSMEELEKVTWEW